MTAALQAFFESDSGKAVYAVLLITAVDWFTGVAAAIRDGTFQLDSVAAFLRKHIAGRVAPIVGFLVIGYFGDQQALTALGVAGAAAYLAETLGSIKDSWGPGRDTQAVPKD